MEPTEGALKERSRPERRLPWALVVALFVVLAVAAPVKIVAKQSSTASKAGTYTPAGSTVKMAGLRFSPATVQVRRGTEVLFLNDDVAPHTVTADSGPTDSGTLTPGKSFRLVVDERFVYHCAIHPSMKATIDILG